MEIEPKIFGLLTRFSRQIFENYILRVHKNNLGTFLQKTNFRHFWNLKGKNYAFSLKSIGGVVKTALYLSTGTFRGVFFGKSTILSLSDVVGELSDLFRKSFGGVVKFCNFVSRETFRGKKIFSQRNDCFSKQAALERKFFGNCGKIFGRPAKTALRVPIRNILKKNTVSEKESVSSQFCKSSGKVFALCWSFIRWVVKISFHVSNGTFWGLCFFPICFLSFPIPDTDRKFPCNFGKHSYGIVKTDSSCMFKCKYWGNNF